jgi:hypothetical protein
MVCRYYARRDLADPTLEQDLTKVREWMRVAGKLHEVPVAYGVSTLVELDDIYQVVMAALKRDPTALLERFTASMPIPSPVVDG